MTFNKTIAGIGVAGATLVAGLWYWDGTEDLAPTEFQVRVDRDDSTDSPEWRLTPLDPALRPWCMTEGSYTLNDLRSEIEIDGRRGGERVECLGDLLEEAERVVQEAEDFISKNKATNQFAGTDE